MKSITYAEHTWLLGDAAAAVVVEYAVLLARTSSADSVDVRALADDGTAHHITLVIGPATMMTAATADVDWAEPDNTEAEVVITERMRIIQSPPVALPASAIVGDVPWEDLA